MRHMEIAYSQLGIQETSGGLATPDIVDYFRDAGRPDVTSDETAWCAAFVGACLARSGIAVTLPKDERLTARSYLKLGTEIDKPRPGAVCVVTRGDRSSWTGHVFFVVGETETHVVGLGGNQADSVSIDNFAKMNVLGYRWVAPPQSVADVAKTSRIAKTASRQKRDAAVTVTAPNVPAPPVVPVELPSPEAIVGKATALQGTIEAGLSFAAFAGKKWPVLMAAVALYYGARMAYDAWRIRQWRIEDAATGKTEVPR